MSAVRDWLRSADPVVDEPPLSETDAQRLRRLVIAAGDERPTSFAVWSRTSVAAVTLVVVLTVAVGVSRWWSPTDDARAVPSGGTAVTAPSSDASTRRQLQFSTPGGTRVIWIFNADFKP